MRVRPRVRNTWEFWIRAHDLWDLSFRVRTYRAIRFLLTGRTGEFRPGPRFLASWTRPGPGGWSEASINVTRGEEE